MHSDKIKYQAITDSVCQLTRKVHSIWAALSSGCSFRLSIAKRKLKNRPPQEFSNELNKSKYLFCALVVFALLRNSAFAEDTSFRWVQLAYGISLDVPSYWTVFSQDNRRNLEAAGQAITDNAGIEGLSSRKESLLAMNAAPNPTGAMIRVSVTSPPDFTQNYLAAVTPGELKEVGAEVLSMFRKLEASGGPKIIEMQPIRIEKFNNYRVLVMPYVRAGNNGLSPWQVTQYKIPVSNRLIEITLSHRQSDAIVWRPILERVKRSVQF